MSIIKKSSVLLFIPFLFLNGCSDNSGNNREISFYHWKTIVDFTPKKQEYLKSLQAKKLYIRFFDVKWVDKKKSSFPFATLQLKKNINDTSIQIVPTVYITNKTLKNTSRNSIPKLANEIIHKIYRLCSSRFYQQLNNQLINEIQFDCDWTLSTKEKYFALIDESRKSEYYSKLNNPKISSTIRLHQVKYFEKTGVPPVDKAMLMFYNVGKVADKETENSILDLETVKKYLINFDDYPLDFDVALPLFSWGVVFRDDHIVKLVNNLSAETLMEHSKFKNTDKNRFKVLESNYINQSFLYKDDEVRVEEVNQEKLLSLIKLISEEAKNNNFNVCFYHLDESIIDNYSANNLLNISKRE